MIFSSFAVLLSMKKENFLKENRFHSANKHCITIQKAMKKAANKLYCLKKILSMNDRFRMEQQQQQTEFLDQISLLCMCATYVHLSVYRSLDEKLTKKKK